MGAVTLHVPFEGWTVDDLPTDVEFRYELVDGALLVTPPEKPRNGRVASRLLVRLQPALPPGVDVLIGQGVYFDRRNYREPDLYVCRSCAVDAGRVEATDVLLAVEVMSPSSVATDRVAQAGAVRGRRHPALLEDRARAEVARRPRAGGRGVPGDGALRGRRRAGGAVRRLFPIG